MTVAEIQKRFEATIDQYYSQLKYMKPGYRKETELEYIGGILQAALHILPWDNYYALKEYVYKVHGYNPGGVGGISGQISISELEVS
jgi:hypothetical protein